MTVYMKRVDSVYERVARLLAQYDAVAWEPLTQRDRDVYMMRAAAVVAVVDIAQAEAVER